MSTYHLESFVKPASVAVVGASRKPGSVGAVITRNLGAFPGRVYRINPHLEPDAAAGIYSRIDQLPEAPELAVVAVPAPGVPAVIAELGARGTRAAVVVSAGFASIAAGTGDKSTISEMLAAADRTGLRIVGPNCIGVLAPAAGLNAGFAQGLPPAGRLAFLSQSGAVLTTLIDWATERRIGFSVLASLGEMAEVDVADWLDYLAMDPQTDAILLYLESVTIARKFLSAARHAARLKPIIVLKAGRTEGAAKAAASHSGALAGSDTVFDAALRRAGAQRVPTLLQMLEAAEILADAQPLHGDSLAIVTNGGGLGVLAADQLLSMGGRLAQLGGETVRKLDCVLPADWSHGNPVDLVGDATPQRFHSALALLLDASEVDAIALMYCPTGLGDPMATANLVCEQLERHPGHKPVLAAWLGPVAASAARQPLAAIAIPNFDTPEALVRGFMHRVDRQRTRIRLSETVPAFPLRGPNDRIGVRHLIDAKLRDGTHWLDEADAKQLLAMSGFSVNETRRAETPDDAATVARALPGPYAVKILSPDLLHKSDVGGVALNIDTAEEVKRVSARMITRLHGAYPNARLAGVSVQTMMSRANAQELIAGITIDPVFGPVIVFGAGGVAVEAMDDTALALPPLNFNLARDLVRETRIHRVLTGAKGRLPAVDMDALYAVLIRLGELVCEFPEIVELDLNPILASPDGAIAIDARIHLEPASGNALDRLAIKPYPHELERPFSLPDGTRCLLRAIRAEDEIPLRTAFEQLSPDQRYMRLFHMLKTLPHELAARFTQIDYDREMAFVIAEDKPAGDAALYGGVRLVTDANRETGEFSITVIDALAGHGIGRQLMDTILRYARDIGLREVFGEILRVNVPMIALCRELGFNLQPSLEPGGESVVTARLRLT